MSITLQGVLLAVIGVLLFGSIIFVHEFGHFFTAKLSGVRVHEFALGMGPRLFSFTRGETQYSLRLLPIGGYCAMEGEDEESDDPGAFGKCPVWQRMVIVAAGGIMNILLAVVMMLIIDGQVDTYATTKVASFVEGSALEAAGVQAGDVITEINGYRIYTDQDLSFALSLAAMDANEDRVVLDIEVRRGKETLRFEDTAVRAQKLEDGMYHILLDFYVKGQERTVWTLIEKSFADTVSTVRLVFESLIGLVTGQFGFNDMAGPVGTAQAVSQVASAGLQSSFGDAVNNILYMMLIISVNLGIVNLLPLPALDGGRLVFLLVELIFRKPVPPKYEGWVHAGGLVLLLGLMAVVTFNDILRIIRG